jgi:hypothetical protein
MSLRKPICAVLLFINILGFAEYLADPDCGGTPFIDAFQKHLGLETKGPVPMLVIDHIERPSEKGSSKE